MAEPIGLEAAPSLADCAPGRGLYPWRRSRATGAGGHRGVPELQPRSAVPHKRSNAPICLQIGHFHSRLGGGAPPGSMVLPQRPLISPTLQTPKAACPGDPVQPCMLAGGTAAHPASKEGSSMRQHGTAERAKGSPGRHLASEQPHEPLPQFGVQVIHPGSGTSDSQEEAQHSSQYDQQGHCCHKQAS